MVENQNIFDGISEDSIVLNGDNISENLIQKYTSLITNRNYWHAFLIHNVTNPKRNETLKIILNYVYPESLLPILFQSRGSDCVFMARNCSGAIFKLLMNKLVIPNPDALCTYTCEIILMYSSISKFSFPPNNISKVLNLLFDDQSRMLNIEKFYDNKELAEYCPLSQPKLLCFVLRISDNMKPACINLKCNEIRTLSPFQVLLGSNSVEKLDLRYNLIEDIEELKYLKIFNLVELWLDGNPLCKKYDKTSYIKSVKEILPMLEKLDGISIGVLGLPKLEQNFLCSNEGFDLVEQFINHFFSLYDNDRKLLVDMYHPSAIFSMTIETCKNIGESDRLLVYKNFTRNLLSSNPSDHEAVIGNIRISNTLCELPQTKHNLQTFSVDLVYYSDCLAVLSITGTFCENMKRNQESEFVFGFKRSFTIFKQLSYYVIYNDLLHIHEVSKFQSEDAPKNHKVKQNCPSRRKAEETMIEEAMCRVTGVHKTWIKRFLRDDDYNIINFLKSFVALVKENKIPEQAYLQNSQHSLMDWLVPKMLEFGMEKFEISLREEAIQYTKANSLLQNKNINSHITNISSIEGLQQQKYEKYGNLNKSGHNIFGKSTLINIVTSDVPNQCSWITRPQINSLSSNLVIVGKEKENEVEINNQKNAANDHDNSNLKTVEKEKNRENIIQNKKDSGCIQRKTSNFILQGNQKHTSEKNTENLKSNSEDLMQEKLFVDIRPSLTLLDNKWLSVNDHEEYDFHQTFNKWTLVLKNKEGNYISKQDDFQKNFTCWKKHFPTYFDENLSHSLQSSCINSRLLSAFYTIKNPVTFWDFPATIPEDIRPPKYGILDGIKKSITPDSDYGFIFMRKKWLLVHLNHLNNWVLLNNEKKIVVWKDNKWIIEPLPQGERMTRNDEPEDTFVIFDDEDVVIINEEDAKASVQVELDEIKAIYAEDVQPEKTITTMNYSFHMSENNEQGNEICKADNLTKWRNLYDIVLYCPRLALIEGYWVVVCNQSNLKFHRTHTNSWMLLEKDCESNEWRELKDDFCSNTFSENIFDHIPMPVTMYDFTSSVPSHLKPTDSLVFDGKIVNVSPDSDYAFVSIKGQWYPVRKNEKNKWEAVHNVHQNTVKKKLANMPSKFETTVEATVDFKSEDNRKISSVICTLFQLLTGVKLVKPLTHWDIDGAEEKRPPKIALTEIDGELQWCCVTPSCGKGFVLEDNVWVKVVSSESGEWKATQFNAYRGCIIGYYLCNNVWVTMKKYILGGKWSPLFNLKTAPTTYWNYIGPEESKPPSKIVVDNMEKIIHNNSNMGFIMKENVWTLMKYENNHWTDFTRNQNCFFYKLIHGMWRIVEKDSKGNWSYSSDSQKIFTYQNFNGLKKYAPPKWVFLLKGAKKIRKTIDEKSGMGFILNDCVWVLMQMKNGVLIRLKSLKGHTDIGYKSIDGKFMIVHMAEKDKLIHLEDKNLQNCNNCENLISSDQVFKNATPLTYDRILLDFPNNLKPPKYALLKDSIDNFSWRLINTNSDYGFIREDDMWLLMMRTVDNNWKDTNNRYKVIDNSWIPMKNENNSWVPVIDPKITPKVPDLCVEDPENQLPYKIVVQSGNAEKVIDINPLSGMGYLKISNEYVLMKKISDEKWVRYIDDSFNALILKYKDNGAWEISPRAISSFYDAENYIDSDQIHSSEKIQTFSGNQGFPNTLPPQYIKMVEEGVLKWKKICFMNGFAFIKRKYWILVKRTEGKWEIVNKDEGYNLIDNRWVVMKKRKDQWLPIFDPKLTPGSYMDYIENSIYPVRVITFKNGHAKYLNTANDCSLGFIMDTDNVCILMREKDRKWTRVEDDFIETPIMAFKNIDGKWQRMKKNVFKEKWVPCEKQMELPILHTDVVGPRNKPPREIVIHSSKNKVSRIKFDVFSNEGFKEIINGIWVLMQPKNGDRWTRYQGIFGTYGYKIDNDEIILMVQVKGKWKQLHDPSNVGRKNIPMQLKSSSKQNIPMHLRSSTKQGFLMQLKNIIMKNVQSPLQNLKTKDNPIQSQNETIKDIPMQPQHTKKKDISMLQNLIIYKNTGNWPDETYPPLSFMIPGWSFEGNKTEYGFVRDKDIWILKKKIGGTWQFEKSGGEYQAYKLIKDRWVAMKHVSNKWEPTFDPSNTPYNFHNTAGKFEDKPPLRINLDNKWKSVFNKSKIAFNRIGDMWVVMRKTKADKWIKYKIKGASIGYKIVDGLWTKFYKFPHFDWKMFQDARLPMLSLDFTPGNKNAPPNSLCFGYSITCKKIKKVELANIRKKGFINDNGAWVLMTKQGHKWVKFDRFPWLKGSFAYILKNNIWRIVMKDFDGSWKCGSLNKNGEWIYGNKLVQVKKPLDIDEIVKLQSQRVLPNFLLIFDSTSDPMPTKVSLTTVAQINFQRQDGVWLLLKFNGQKWEILGGVIAYLMIDNRWVTMNLLGNTWVPAYDPITTPITHFESVELCRPPLRIVINETGVDQWKVIFQHSGYGFLKQGDLWVLMKMSYGGTWVEHQDYFLELTGYSIVDLKWKRFKKTVEGNWKCRESSLPLLKCDFSIHHQKLPPPLFHDFLQDPTITCENTDTNLSFYSDFGYKEDNKVWILMECDNAGLWSEHKFFINQTELFGFQSINNIWQLLKKDRNGSWINGKLIYSNNNGWTFIEANTKQHRPKEIITNESDIIDGNTNRAKESNDQGTEIENNIAHNDDEWVFIEENSMELGPKKMSTKVEVTKSKKKRKLKYKKKNKTTMKEQIENNKQNKKEIKTKRNGNEKEIHNQEVCGKAIENKNQDGNVPKVIHDQTNKIKECNDQGDTIPNNTEQNEREIQIKDEPSCFNSNKKREKKDMHGREIKCENKEVEAEERVEQNIVDNSEQKVRNENILVENSIQQNEYQIKNEQLGEDETEQAKKIAISQVIESRNDKEQLGEYRAEQAKGIAISQVIECRNDKQNVEHSTVQTRMDTTEQEAINLTEHTNSEEKLMNRKIENEEINKFEIAITNPVKYHELSGLSIGEKPPKNVCLNIRGLPRRIPLISKSSKIGFQHHNGVWVLLERLSGVWKILHNSAGIPIAYKLIDNRWVSMRIDRNGSWISTFNPLTTPRTFFDTEGPDDSKPPRRVVINENGVLKWREITEFSGFGFLKKDDMWVLMKKSPNTKWTEYMTVEQELCAFKMQDSKWTKFTKRPDDNSWKSIVENLPVLQYDFATDSKAAPPIITNHLLRKNKLEATNVGFSWNNGAWVLMERDESDNWTSPKSTCGFARAFGEFWNLLEKDEFDQWKIIESNCEFDLIFEKSFQPHVKREGEVITCPHNKKPKTFHSEFFSEGLTKLNINETISMENKLVNQVQQLKSVRSTQEQKETESSSAEVSTTVEPATIIEQESGDLHSEAEDQKQLKTVRSTQQQKETESSSTKVSSTDEQTAIIEHESRNLHSEAEDQKQLKTVRSTQQQKETESSSTKVSSTDELTAIIEHESRNLHSQAEDQKQLKTVRSAHQQKETESSSTKVSSTDEPTGIIEHKSGNLHSEAEDQKQLKTVRSTQQQKETESSSTKVSSTDEQTAIIEHESRNLHSEAEDQKQLKTVRSAQQQKETESSSTKVSSTDEPTAIIEHESRNLHSEAEDQKQLKTVRSAQQQKETESRSTKVSTTDEPTAIIEHESGDLHSEAEDQKQLKSVRSTQEQKDTESSSAAVSTTDESTAIIEHESRDLHSEAEDQKQLKSVRSTQEEKDAESSSTEVSTTDEPATIIEHESGYLHSGAECQKISPNEEDLNDVERYLAIKPDCCIGCPELQDLLRNHRPTNMPVKILRKKFRLPDGSFRLLSIPKAVFSKPDEVDKNIGVARKRGPDSEEEPTAKRIKYQQE